MLPSAEQLIAFGLTCLVEVPLFVLGCRALGWTGPPSGRVLRGWQALLLGLGLNVLSHPLLWMVASHLPATVYLVWFFAAEAGVVLLEALVAWLVVRRDPGWALLLCLGTNAASMLTGLLLR
ncbi:MAG: hypothetical protein ACTH2Q_06040 [Propionibacteriaceae bacterium]